MTLEEFVKNVDKRCSNICTENEKFISDAYCEYEKLCTRKKLFYPFMFRRALKLTTRSKLQRKFWLERGWSEADAIQKVHEIQKENSKTVKDRMDTDPAYKEARRITMSTLKEKQKVSGSFDKMISGIKGVNTVEYWEKKIDPATGINYTKEAASEKLKFKQGAFYRNIWKRKRAGEDVYHMNTTVEFYTDKGMNLEEARIALSERQATFSLEKCIKRHGIERGTEIWQNRQIAWQKTLQSKTEEEKIEILQKKLKNFKRYSKSSFELFRKVEEEIGESVTFFYGENERFVWDKEVHRIYFYDLYVKELNLLVEYQGVCFHPKETLSEEELSKWKSLFIGADGISVKAKDEKKKSLAIENGYDYLVLWEDDSEIRQKLTKYIKEKLRDHGNTTN